jgi:hypothetical protein
MMQSLLINLLSDLIFSILVFIFWYFIFLISKRNKLMKFFNIENSKKLTIYTSNLIVEKFGSSGLDKIRYSYQGTAIPYEESKAAAELIGLFNYFLPSQIEKSTFLSKVLISDVDVKVFPSPIKENIFEQYATKISLGLPPYNLVSRMIEETQNPFAKLDYVPTNPENKSNMVKTGSQGWVTQSSYEHGTIAPSVGMLTSGSAVPSQVARTDSSYGNFRTSASTMPDLNDKYGEPIQPVIKVIDVDPFCNTSIGFVQKTIDNKNKRTFFYIAGLSENSTAGSAYFLVKNWEKLSDKYGNDNPFLILLKIDNSNNQLSEIVFER